MNCLITQDGKQIDCTAGRHDIICRLQLKKTLVKFLSTGGIRVMVRHDTIAVEFYNDISDKQNRIINKVLKEQPIYVLIMPFKQITKYRPIRYFDFKGALVLK